MTGTDLRRGSRRGPPRRRRPGLPGILALVAGFGLAVPGTGSGLGAQEPRTITIRSGSGWIGVNVRVESSPEAADDRITLTDVLSGSPAAAAGLRPGDRVVAVNGIAVDAERFRSLTSRLEAGDPIALTVLRDGEEVEVAVVAGARPAPAQIVAVRLQEELDSVRSHLVRILESPDLPAAPGEPRREKWLVEAPTIRVEQVGADSIATRILIQRPDGAVLALVEAPEGIREARVVRPPGTGPTPPAAEEARRLPGVAQEARVAAEAARRAAEAEAVRAPLRLEAEERERARREAGLSENAWPTRSIEEVRPLSPYLAGLTRVAGAEVRTLNPGLAPYFGVQEGLLVTEVAEGTPAAEAGLRGGDVIVASGGRPITTLAQLRESLATRDGGRLDVVRQGERLSLTLLR